MLKLPRAHDAVAALPADVWNDAADELERLSNFQAAPPLELTDGPAGRRLALRNTPDRLYWGVVQCTGPLGTELVALCANRFESTKALVGYEPRK
jgi:predicted short-subunit dehydrogenase-like oxidoreductase (DUF2520 family)